MFLAQASPESSTPIWLFALLGLGVLALALLIVIFVLSLRYFHAGRQLQHAERMRSIEVGYPLEGERFPANPVARLHGVRPHL